MTQPAEIRGNRAARVLICEDEAIVAFDLEMIVQEMGLEVLGTCASREKARALIARECPDVAILDVNLVDGEVFPLAEKLSACGTGLVFQSGHCASTDIGARFPLARICEKPIAVEELKRCITSLLDAASARNARSA